MVWPRDQNAPREVGKVSHVVCYTKGRVTQMPAKQKWSDYVSDQTWSRLGVEPAELLQVSLKT